MINEEVKRGKEGVHYNYTSFPTWLGRADPWEVIKAAQQAVEKEPDTPMDPFRAIYLEVLGREPDEGGYNFWKGHYEAKRMTLGEVILAVEQSDEALGK